EETRLTAKSRRIHLYTMYATMLSVTAATASVVMCAGRTAFKRKGSARVMTTSSEGISLRLGHSMARRAAARNRSMEQSIATLDTVRLQPEYRWRADAYVVGGAC